METEKLQEWKNSLEHDADSIRKQIQALTASLQKKTQQIELISKLIDSANEHGRNLRGPVAEVPHDTSNSRTVLPSQVKDHVYEILAERKRPMNINEIHSEFIRRSYPIPGKGTSFNILVHISREMKLGRKSRFYRAGRGTYCLRDGNASDAR
jgi:hypothetical protein